ncbi:MULTISPECIES: DNA repair protein RecO [Chryseobacterium]|uniref:DNA repair protein RecO (Recombination protein O) n=1 Tax=Chryseobacterium camelliae TaxID=1265445 RepID=A0ABU0TD79_9FLAO|nr:MULTISPECIES: DNA repair protein RecO [Chryseobacterium]MDT3407185.1 DNA repair protein RecO (recombination protein O) [Pseudacidovorax intermedius]MDQ1095024.1 DNA repair protein RecO (recombination protein O) [Chryseobacterium camelliae]MDQ1098964.1 DNA repair protein RecO (recombination protein O) [Chryseobacterium sp. SORGH_AS_1048]MDR6086312.1 DNA repair protein RecO (recombination protein O) [Chryseobacterium sp. SORGH_AS_0909]MDR6130684.1 DNA repair protein RecO (recombination protei
MNLQNGFLLSYIKYGDHDAVLHCFTEEEGFQACFLKGIYAKKNKKKALLQPLNRLSFTVNPIKGNGIYTASRLELVNNYDMYTDVKINTIVFFVSDFLNQVLREEHKNPGIFSSIAEFIEILSHRNYQSHLTFLVKILKIHGVAPLVTSGQYLDPETGTFSSGLNHQLFTADISELWKNIISSPQPYDVKIPAPLRKDFLDSILVYYHYHITDFKIPASLEIIQQIFE